MSLGGRLLAGLGMLGLMAGFLLLGECGVSGLWLFGSLIVVGVLSGSLAAVVKHRRRKRLAESAALGAALGAAAVVGEEASESAVETVIDTLTDL